MKSEFGDIVYEKENVMSYSNCDCIFDLLINSVFATSSGKAARTDL